MRNVMSRVRAGIARVTRGFRRRTASSASSSRTSGS
jgi:hypothetical protein